MTSAPSRATILGVVLAGGLARRMGGGDKGLLPLAGRPVIAHVVARALPQVGRLIVNANGDPTRFAGCLDGLAASVPSGSAPTTAAGLPIVADALPDFPGPLAGLHAAMLWARASAPAITHVATFATDTPFFPADLVARLAAALAETADADIAIAASGNSPQPVFALVPVALADRLGGDIVAGTARRVLNWLRSVPCVEVAFDTPGGIDPFFNINTPDDLNRAEALASARPDLIR